MICIELPLWLVILLAVSVMLLLIHSIIGDLLLKWLYKKYNCKEKKNDELG